MSPASETLSGALVTLFLFTDNRAASSRWTATTGADGAFDFPRLPAGRYRVAAERAGYTGLEVTATGMRTGRDFPLTDSEIASVAANRDQGVATGSDGAFRLDGVIGPQRLVVQPLPPTWGIVAVRRGGAVIAGGIVSVESAQTIDGVEVIVGPRTP